MEGPLASGREDRISFWDWHDTCLISQVFLDSQHVCEGPEIGKKALCLGAGSKEAVGLKQARGTRNPVIIGIILEFPARIGTEKRAEHLELVLPRPQAS